MVRPAGRQRTHGPRRCCCGPHGDARSRPQGVAQEAAAPDAPEELTPLIEALERARHRANAATALREALESEARGRARALAPPVCARPAGALRSPRRPWPSAAWRSQRPLVKRRAAQCPRDAPRCARRRKRWRSWRSRRATRPRPRGASRRPRPRRPRPPRPCSARWPTSSRRWRRAAPTRPARPRSRRRPCWTRRPPARPYGPRAPAVRSPWALRVSLRIDGGSYQWWNMAAPAYWRVLRRRARALLHSARPAPCRRPLL